MFLLIIFLICVFITLIIGGLAGLSDFRSLKIPNIYSLYVMAAFFVAWLSMYIGGNDDVFSGLLTHLLSAALMFVVTVILFALRIIGAGDSKFATACSLWISPSFIMIFLFFMTLAGGLLGGVAIYMKRKKPFENPVKGGWIEQVQGGADKVPYGIAISFGMLIAFVYAGYFSSDVLFSFLGARTVGSGS